MFCWARKEVAWPRVASGDVERGTRRGTQFEGGFLYLDLLVVGQVYQGRRGVKNIFGLGTSNWKYRVVTS